MNASLAHYAKVVGAGLKRQGEVGQVVQIDWLGSEVFYHLAFSDGQVEKHAERELCDVTAADMQGIYTTKEQP